MFQIFDTNGKPVGRPQGYKMHATAERLIARPGRIRRDIYDAFARAPMPANGRKLVYSIRWID